MDKIREEFIRRAVNVLNAPKGLVAQKVSYLKHRGCTDDEITVALDRASGGVVGESLFS